MTWNISDFFDINESHAFWPLFENTEHVWDLLIKRNECIQELLKTTFKPEICSSQVSKHAIIDDNVFIDKDVVIEEFTTIKGPTIILSGTHVRQGAYIRGNCLVGKNCVVGHTTELKAAVMLDGAKAPHYNYVGDCVLGSNINLGAGTKLSNVKISPGNISVRIDGTKYDTGIRKFSVIMGDNTQTGCNSVINPGSIIERDCLIYPNTSFSGYIKKNTICKLKQKIVSVERRNV